MKVRELMIRDLTSVETNDTIRKLVEILESSETSSVPVTDDKGRLVGIISECDVLAASVPRYVEFLRSAADVPSLGQLAVGLNRIADEPVKRYMSREVIAVEREEDDLRAADLMLRHKLKLLPVVDARGRLVGVVRRVDLFKHVL